MLYVPPFSGSFLVSVHTHFHYVCRKGTGQKAAKAPGHHPCPRTTSSRHCAGKISCPLFIPPSSQARLLASFSRCLLSVLVTSREGSTRAPGAREARSYRPGKHLQARPCAMRHRRGRKLRTEQLTIARSSRTSPESLLFVIVFETLLINLANYA